MTGIGGRRLVCTGAATLVVGAASGLSPLALVPLLGLLALGLVTAWPAGGVIAAVPILLLDATVSQYPGLHLVQYGSEAIIVLLTVATGLRWLVGRQPIVYASMFGWAVAFLCVGLLSGVVAGVPLTLLLSAAFLALKGWLFAFVVAQVDWQERDLRRLLRTGALLTMIIFVTSLVNLAAPGWWASTVGASGSVEYRWFVPSLVGLFLYAINYGEVLSLVAAALASLAVCLRGRARTLTTWAAGLACVFALLSARRLSAVAVLAALLVVLVVRRSASLWIGVAAALPLVVFLSAPTVAQIWQGTASQYLNANSGAARTLLTLRAFDVAAAHFPFGAGFGRYGSFVAGADYSPEYYRLGFDHVYGLMPTPPYNEFLDDTFWPAVLGEGGYIGAFCYLAAVLAVFRLALRVFRTGSGPARTVALMTFTVWIGVLVLSPGGQVLNTGAIFVLPCLLLGVLCRLSSAAGPGSSGGATADASSRKAAGGSRVLHGRAVPGGAARAGA